MNEYIGRWTWDVTYEIADKKEVHIFIVAASTIQGALAEAMQKTSRHVGTLECKITGVQRRNQIALEEETDTGDE
jgi:hypothetical protein